LRRRLRPGRPVRRSLADGLVFLAALLLLVLGIGRTGWFAPETGRFAAIDGDSLRKGEQEYRLHGIDAPELHQSCASGRGADYPCGRRARDRLGSLVDGRALDCSIRETDRYGRLVVQCSAEGVDINREMVRSGWAIAYRRHGTAHGAAEAEAKAARRGIWQGGFETPEHWRARNRDGLMRGAASEASSPED